MYEDASCTRNFPPGVGNRTGLATPLLLPQSSLEYIHLHVYDPSKKYNPPYITAHQLCFWAFAFIRAPLPSWIARTEGTLFYKNILLSSCSWDLWSYSFCTHLWSCDQWSCVWQRIIDIIVYLLFFGGCWGSTAIGFWSWFLIGTMLQLWLLFGMRGVGRGNKGGEQVQSNCLAWFVVDLGQAPVLVVALQQQGCWLSSRLIGCWWLHITLVCFCWIQDLVWSVTSWERRG